jgi:hypothetical protein
MSLQKLSYTQIKGYPVTVDSFGAVGDGVTDDTAALQTAIDAAIAAKKDLFIQSGTYKITDTLNVTSTSIKIYGAGRYETKINSYAVGSAIKFAGWGGVLDNLGIYTQNATGSGIEAGTVSRNCAISNVYIQAYNLYDPTNTGAGIYLNAGTGFSGGIEIRTTYCLGFKYGVKMVGTNLATGTWTTVSMFNLWIASSTTIANSVGIYMDALTNGIGTRLDGGTIEGCVTGIKVEDGSYGGTFNTDMEGNTADYVVGNAFQGSITSAFNVPNYSIARNGAGGSIWNQYQLLSGTSPKQENYYAPEYQVIDPTGAIQITKWYRSAGSIIDGTATEPHALKFAVGLGLGGTYGIDVHPSQHFIQVDDRKIHWDAISPQAETGSQIVAWVQGSVCYNSAATVGQPKGWICTVSGTPGTWVSMGNL